MIPGINLDDKLVVFHVGGSQGSYGPIDFILKTFPGQCVLVVFEARDTDEEAANQSLQNLPPANVSTTPTKNEPVLGVAIHECIGEKTGKSDFYILGNGDSSSLFRPSKTAQKEYLEGYPKGIATWGDNTPLVRKETIQTINLSDFCRKKNLWPDVLSLDVQGAEYNLLTGYFSGLSLTNCLVTEVEFSEIYEGQGLFDSQMSLLRRFGFRLMDLLSVQYWHPGPVYEKGFLTVGEAVWLKSTENFFLYTPYTELLRRGIKLSAVAFAFDRISFARKIVGELCSRFGRQEVVNEIRRLGFAKLADGGETNDVPYFNSVPIGSVK